MTGVQTCALPISISTCICPRRSANSGARTGAGFDRLAAHQPARYRRRQPLYRRGLRLRAARDREPSAQRGQDGMREIGYTRESFEQLPTFGLCDRNNLKTSYLRRGRLPSGCNHISLKPVQPTDRNVPAWPAFVLKIFEPLPAPCANGSGV